MKTIPEMIAVMQAAERGEAIQCLSRNSKPEWRDCEPHWDWEQCDYRVKPREPRRWWHCVNDTDSNYTSHRTRELAELAASELSRSGPAAVYQWRVIEVVEVFPE